MKNGKQTDLKKDREFGEMISELINFFKYNFKALMGIYVRYALSIIVVGFVIGLVMNFTMGMSMESDIPMQLGGFGNIVFLFSFMIATLMLTAALYGYITGYVEEGPEAAAGAIAPNFWRNMGNVLLVFLSLAFAIGIIGLIMFVLMDLALIAGLLFFPLGILMLYFWVKFSLAPYINTLEGHSVSTAFGESYDLTEGRWWWTFGLIFIMGMIGSLLMYIIMIPFMILMYVPQFVGGLEGTGDGGGMGLMMLLSNFFTYGGYMIYSMITILLIPFMYYALADRKYGISIKERIENPDDSAADSIFENEGEV